LNLIYLFCLFVSTVGFITSKPILKDYKDDLNQFYLDFVEYLVWSENLKLQQSSLPNDASNNVGEVESQEDEIEAELIDDLDQDAGENPRAEKSSRVSKFNLNSDGDVSDDDGEEVSQGDEIEEAEPIDVIDEDVDENLRADKSTAGVSNFDGESQDFGDSALNMDDEAEKGANLLLGVSRFSLLLLLLLLLLKNYYWICILGPSQSKVLLLYV
jgi:hypothetical protein